ncbi:MULTISPECIES: hypothetical protein [unclassified Yoonia]|uniref:hypothetical protein n=1 Tax=unclassified Yoonia TaxID=2629118 RepID=UPI002AFED2C2|nr:MULTISPECIES: hypothetical protein [unclassified Yoonia]
MAIVYRNAFTDLDSTVSFGGGGGRRDRDRENRQNEFARQNSAARNSRGRYDPFNGRDATNLATAVGVGMAGAAAKAGARIIGGMIAVVSERQR